MPNVRSVIAQSRSRGAGPLIYPSNIAKYGMLFMFSKYDYTDTKNVIQYSADSFTGESVVLPLPTGGLQESTNISLNETDLTSIGAGIAQASNLAFSGGDLSSLVNFSGADGNFDPAAVFRVLGVTTATGAAMIGLDKAAGLIAGAQAGLSVGTGTSFNKFTALSFSAVDLRSHSFNWRFFPERREDSDKIAQIRKLFQKAAHPSYANLGTGSGTDILGRTVLNYPMLVRPYILIDQSEDYYYQFKPCLISSVQFSYRAEAGMAFVGSGKPAQIEMTLNMKEASIWTAEDYGGGDDSLSAWSGIGDAFQSALPNSGAL